ncbi:hypothetical protein [Afipia sp. GAS231]|uniref:hypothetical protein n=1 Tax=Afipia sp. GAS231 TaxID=1882747 RepID=UPI0012F92876|nr:hypothetical protein [Afipia sp. GAS231]
MSEIAEPAKFHFTFRVTEADGTIFRQLLIKNTKPYLSKLALRGIPLLAFTVILVPTITAQYFDKLPLSAVLMTELSFAVGYLAAVAGLLFATRRMQRDLFKHTRSARELFDCSFDDSGVTVGKGTLVSRMTWDAISAVEDIGIIVAFWYDPTQGFFLPYHVFKDDASRIAFSTWAKERARDAASVRPAAAPI